MFKANPTTIQNPGDVSTLIWHTKNATSVSISDIGPVSLSGSAMVKPLRTTPYVLTATNENGKITRNFDVSVLSPSTSTPMPRPIPSDLPPPTPKPKPPTSPRPTSPSETTPLPQTPPKAPSTHKTEPPPPPPKIVTFRAQPDSIPDGDPTKLIWETINAKSVSITDIGEVPLSGSKEVKPEKTTTYAITAKKCHRAD